MLTPEEVFEIIRHANTLRDKALIFMLYESAARPHEILRLNIKHVVFDKYGVRLTIPSNTKTGSRVLRLIDCVNILAQYLATHELKDCPDAPLFYVKYRGEIKRYRYATFRSNLKKYAKLAGIKKNVHPYLLRHSRLTFLAKYLTESQLCAYAGWVQGSSQAKTYVHLSMRDLDDAILRIHGLKKQVSVDGSMKVVCSRCGALNNVTSEFCINCGMPLQLKAALKKDEEIEKTVEEKVKEIIQKEMERRRVYDDMMARFLELLSQLVKEKPNLTLGEAIEFIRQKMVTG